MTRPRPAPAPGAGASSVVSVLGPLDERSLPTPTIADGATGPTSVVTSAAAASRPAAAPDAARPAATPDAARPAWRVYGQALRSPEGVAALATAALALAGWLWSVAGLEPTLVARLLAAGGAVAGGGLIAVGAVRGLRRRELNVDELVTLALLASLVAQEYLSAALVAFMMLAGKVLEDLTARRATAAIEALGTLLPQTARVRLDGRFVMRPLSELAPGDVVLVRPGERIPVDGVVLAGRASVDQAALTGESVPVAARAGDRVLAGTLVQEGALEVEATAVAAESTLGAVSRFAAEAIRERAPVVRAADRYARYVTPAVLALAALTWLATGRLLNAVGVLVAACPCVLVLATPTAMVAGVVAGARRGLLVRGGARLEAAAAVRVVALDKTGTLTLGEPAVVEVRSLGPWASQEVLAAAAAVEALSEHPVARAIVTRARAEGLAFAPSPVEAFSAVPGLGVCGLAGGRRVSVGTVDLLAELGVAVSNSVQVMLSQVHQDGLMGVLVAIDGTVAGLVTLADRPRPGAAALVRALRRAGVERIVMLTGDAPAVARAVGRRLGIDEVYAALLPRDKARRVEQLRAAGKRVAMIGDGVNDAPALAVADVAVAMGTSAADVTRHAADIVVLSNELPRAVEALLLSRATMGVVWQNLILAAIWNAVTIAAAATGLIAPVGAALAHNAGSVLVVVNAARLAGWQPPREESGPA